VYILATFFALLIPVYLLRPEPSAEELAVIDAELDQLDPLEPDPPVMKETMLRRLGRAVVLNLRSQVLVALNVDNEWLVIRLGCAFPVRLFACRSW
jgi:hypothetical protein